MIPTPTQISTLLRQLIAFPTVSSETNLDLITWVEQYLAEHGVPSQRINAHGKKASLLARIGPDVPGGIVLSGHTDVVPVRDQPWETDPFTLHETETHLYGRGTADMKSFLALALAHIPYFQSLTLQRPIWLAFSHDEEIGCLGAAPMAEAILAADIAPALVVIGEPTLMQLIGGHKGIHSFETIVTGHEAHSSMPEQGVNAVMIMGELMACLNTIAREATHITQAEFAHVTPYTSVHIGVIEGGTARNIIPRHCRIAWEVRPLPGTDVAALLAPFYARCAQLEQAMQQRNPATHIKTRPMTTVRGLELASPDAHYLTLACRLAGANHAESVAFGTEGGIFQGFGLPVVVCGPGSIDQAHQPNEYISREQLALGASFMQRVGEACAA